MKHNVNDALAGLLVAIEDLTHDPKNARKHNKENIAAIQASLREFGQQKPIVLSADGRTVIAGNGTLTAAAKLGWTHIAAVPSGLDGSHAKAFAISDNRSAEMAEWDYDVLRETIADLHAIDAGIVDSLAWDVEDFLPAVETSAELVDDEVPEPPVEPITHPGDLWILGQHRLLCGDSTRAEDAARLMAGFTATMCLTDPPYNINYGNIKHPKFKQREIQNDNMDAGAFREFCQKFTAIIKESVAGCVYVFGPPGPDGRIMFTALDDAMHCSTTIVWNKDQFTLGRGKYQNKYEPCWFGWVNDGSRFVDDRTLTNVWDFARPKASIEHPTMKPVPLMGHAIQHASRAGDIVYDPFLGSGTTMIAAEQLGRRCFGMELDPKYCDVIVARWEKLTGRKGIVQE